MSNSDAGGVGILGLGSYLPSEVRTNDWWPQEIAVRWAEKNETARARQRADAPATEGERLVMEAVAATLGDPFRGAKERRVMSADMRPSDMEIAAARMAIDDSRVDPNEIGLLLTYSVVPDHAATNQAVTIHRALGLRRECFSLSVDAVCNSFLMQLALAEDMIRAGRTDHALLIQSSGISPLLPYDQPHSPWFGDGATAVVVGRVPASYGVLGASHICDGRFQNALVAGVPGRRWYDEGRVLFFPLETKLGARMFLATADTMREVIEGALASAGMDEHEVDFFACHQGTPWLQRVAQVGAGLSHARTCDLFPTFASLFAANIPLVLSVARSNGSLNDGAIVATCSAGVGVTVSSCVMRWGRG